MLYSCTHMATVGVKGLEAVALSTTWGRWWYGNSVPPKGTRWLMCVTAESVVGGGSHPHQLRQLQLYRHEMQHFVQVLHEYIASEVVTVSWHEFQQDLSGRHIAGVDDLCRRHLDYLHKCRFRFDVCCRLHR